MVRYQKSVKGKLISLVINGRKTSQCVFSGLVGMISDKQVVDFALDSSHLTSLKVTGLKNDILGRSFKKVTGTLRWSSRLNDLHVWFQFYHRKSMQSPQPAIHQNLVALDFPPGSLVREFQ